MKTKLISFFLMITLSTMALAIDKYTENMQKYISQVYTAQTFEQLQSAINAFDRIAQAEPTRWEPLYYSAFGNLMTAVRQQEGSKKDQYLDLALASIEKAKKLVPGESEVIALEGFVHMIRVTVDPATRGQQFSGLALQTFGKAVQLNPNNPRALSLMAQMQMGTARFFNAPVTEACGVAKRALEKFDTFTSDNPLAPRWGKEMTEELLTSCN